MKAIIGNCGHGGSVCVWIDLSATGKPVALCKSSSRDGAQDLRREMQGIDWYVKRGGGPMSYRIMNERAEYLAFATDYIDGRQYSPRDGLMNNAEPVFALVKHYAEIWDAPDKDGKGALHGDLALGNAIFVNGKPTLVDWEHFQEGGAPLGFDALYLIYTCLWFETWGKKPRKDSLQLIGKIIAYLIIKSRISPEVAISPLANIRRIIVENKDWWRGQIGKLPPLLYSNAIVESTDAAIDAMTGLRENIK